MPESEFSEPLQVGGKKHDLSSAFFSFLQIGMFSFGGGYAAMPLIQGQVVKAHAWLSMAEFTDLITISQMTPGPIAVNSATFVGLKIAGVFGAFAATLGCILPSCIIVTIIARLYPEIPEIVHASGHFKIPAAGSGGHDWGGRNFGFVDGLWLGQSSWNFCFGVWRKNRLEPGGDFCSLSGASSKKEKSSSCNGGCGSDENPLCICDGNLRYNQKKGE